MALHSHPPGERTAYHHGNLREALVETALVLIDKYGPMGFSYADVARAAGVSPAAPYRHFPDREALMAEVARRGFERFATDLEAAWNNGRPDPATALEACGQAYLVFAEREPASFAAMFGVGSRRGDDPALGVAAERAFSVLRRAADAVAATFPPASRPPALMVALHSWAMAHGIASLFLGPGHPFRPLPMTPRELLESYSLIYLQGLRRPSDLTGAS